MSGLKRILTRTAGQRLAAGGALSANVVPALHAYRTRLFATFIALFSVLVCVAAFGAYGLAQLVTQPGHMKGFAAAMGISVGGLTESMRRIWKEWSQAELLLILVEDASESQVRDLIDRAIKKL